MLKVLKFLSVVSISAPLILISCSHKIPSEISNISIDRIKLEENFEKDPSNSTFISSSVEAFITDFNNNPQNYFTSNNPPVPTAIPFITANMESFSQKKISETLSKPIISSEISSNLPSFKTIKFKLELKSNYSPKVIIIDSPSSALKPINTNAFSMDFRVLIPEINTENRELEITWIKNFFSKNFINFIDLDIKKTTLAKSAAQVIGEIKNKTEFERIFKMNIPFPSKLITGWEYHVEAVSNPNDLKSIKLKFSLTNILFKDADALTPAETNIELIVDGFASE